MKACSWRLWEREEMARSASAALEVRSLLQKRFVVVIITYLVKGKQLEMH